MTDEETRHLMSTHFPVSQFLPLRNILIALFVTCYEVPVFSCCRRVSSVLLACWKHVWRYQSLLSRDNWEIKCWYTGDHFSDISCKFPIFRWSYPLALSCSSSCKNVRWREEKGQVKEDFCISILMFWSSRKWSLEQQKWRKCTFSLSLSLTSWLFALSADSLKDFSRPDTALSTSRAFYGPHIFRSRGLQNMFISNLLRVRKCWDISNSSTPEE